MSNRRREPWIAFLGADGAGKSTIIDAVREWARGRGVGVEYHHWRPLLADEGSTVNVDPHSEVTRSSLMSFVKVFYLLFVWWKWAIRRRLDRSSRSELVISDRYYGDLLCDPRRYRFQLPMWLTRGLLQCMPKPDLVVLLDASPEVLLSRKKEVSADALVTIVQNYREYIVHVEDGVSINAEEPVDEVIASVMSIVEKKNEIFF